MLSKAEWLRRALVNIRAFPGMADHALFLYHAGMDYPAARMWLQNYSEKYHKLQP